MHQSIGIVIAIDLILYSFRKMIVGDYLWPISYLSTKKE